MYIGKTQSGYVNPFYTQSSGASSDATSKQIGRMLGNNQSYGSMADMSGLMTQMFQMQMMIQMFKKMGYDMGDFGPKKTGKPEPEKSGKPEANTPADKPISKDDKSYTVGKDSESLRDIVKRRLGITNNTPTDDEEKQIKAEEERLKGLNPNDIAAKITGDVTLDNLKVAGNAKLLLLDKTAANPEAPSKDGDDAKKVAVKSKSQPKGPILSGAPLGDKNSNKKITRLKNENILEIHTNEKGERIVEEYTKDGHLVSKDITKGDTGKHIQYYKNPRTGEDEERFTSDIKVETFATSDIKNYRYSLPTGVDVLKSFDKNDNQKEVEYYANVKGHIQTVSESYALPNDLY